MRPLGKLFFALDRTLVLFLGMAAGAIIAISFFPGGDPSSDAQAKPVLPATAAARAAPVPDQVGPRLASAIAEGRQIEIGVFGDSFGDGVWAGLYHQLRGDDRFEVHQFSERSTGFTRYRSLNLLDDVRAKLERQPVDIAVLSYGANDTQGIFLDGHGYTYMSEGWQRIVTERVTAIVQLLRQRGVTVYWVGLPKMRDAHFDSDVRQMDRFYAERMRNLGVPYVETAPLTADASGQYAPYLVSPRTHERFMARTNDGIHMTIPGYVVVMRGLSDRIRGAAGPARAEARRGDSEHAASQSGREARPRG
jgi:hypothetical protein